MREAVAAVAQAAASYSNKDNSWSSVLTVAVRHAGVRGGTAPTAPEDVRLQESVTLESANLPPRGGAGAKDRMVTTLPSACDVKGGSCSKRLVIRRRGPRGRWPYTSARPSIRPRVKEIGRAM